MSLDLTGSLGKIRLWGNQDFKEAYLSSRRYPLAAPLALARSLGHKLVAETLGYAMKLSPSLLPTIASLVSLRAVDAWIPASKLDQHLQVFAAQHEEDESKNGRIATTATADRRQLLEAIWRSAITTSSTVVLVDIAVVSTPGRAWASSDGGDDKVEDLACRIGNKKLKRKISDVREAVEMTSKLVLCRPGPQQPIQSTIPCLMNPNCLPCSWSHVPRRIRNRKLPSQKYWKRFEP